MVGEWSRDGFPQRQRGLGPGGRGALGRYVEDVDMPAGGRDLPTEERPYGRTGLRSLFPAGPDFGPFFLEEADQYYMGPKRSTRVKAHQFMPDDPLFMNKLEDATQSGMMNQNQFLDFNIMGKIYVRFIKYNSLWQYGTYVSIPLAEYRNFRNSVSKGKSVRYLEQYGHGPVDSVPPGLEI